MKYEFDYVFPFYKIVNLILYPIIVGICFWRLITPAHQNANKFEAILTLGSIGLFLFTRFISLLFEWYNTRNYQPIKIDDLSITFPFLIDNKTLTWNFQNIDYIQISYEKNLIRRNDFIELSKKEESLKLYKSWMRIEDFEQLKEILQKQNIPIKEPI